MVLVVLAAIAFGVVVRRRDEFTRRAEYHNSRIGQVGSATPGKVRWRNQKGEFIYEEKLFSGYNDLDTGITHFRDAPPRLRRYWARIRANQDWHKVMKQKYLRAAARPWLPVAPDTSEPQLPNGPDDP
jgi:hypothetical protein